MFHLPPPQSQPQPSEAIVIDTVEYEQEWIVVAEDIDFGPIGIDWILGGYAKGENDPGTPIVRFGTKYVTYVHKETGLRAVGYDNRVKRVTFSAPRLLWGHNGRLIKSQAEIDAALAKANRIMSTLGTVVHPKRTFRRVDLVWQFFGSVLPYKQAYGTALCPGIRSSPDIYTHSSVRWAGSEMNLTIYDKGREMGMFPDRVVRAEIQFKKARKVRHAFDSEVPVHHLDFDHCYRIYRRILTGFDPDTPVEQIDFKNITQPSIEERLAWITAQAALDGKDYSEIATFGVCNKTRARFRRLLAHWKERTFRLRWADSLPLDGPPEAVEISPPEEITPPEGIEAEIEY